MCVCVCAFFSCCLATVCSKQCPGYSVEMMLWFNWTAVNRVKLCSCLPMAGKIPPFDRFSFPSRQLMY